MFYIVSKMIDVLAMPLSITLVLLLYGFIAKNRKRGRRSVIAGFVWLYICSNPVIVNELTKYWEGPIKYPQELKKNYEFGVVLTGGLAKKYDMSQQYIWTGRQFDRAAQAFQLYKLGKIKKILISGNDGLVTDSIKNTEAIGVAAYLIKSGVNKNDILLDGNSSNTHKNAVFSTQILQKKYNVYECVVITSAFHLPRAVGCFTKEGMNVEGFPSAFLQHKSFFWFDAILPSEEALYKFYYIWHELIGCCVYKLMGYI